LIDATTPATNISTIAIVTPNLKLFFMWCCLVCVDRFRLKHYSSGNWRARKDMCLPRWLEYRQ
jgi:hypothetical protein